MPDIHHQPCPRCWAKWFSHILSRRGENCRSMGLVLYLLYSFVEPLIKHRFILLQILSTFNCRIGLCQRHSSIYTATHLVVPKNSNKPWVVIEINYQLWHPDKYNTPINNINVSLMRFYTNIRRGHLEDINIPSQGYCHLIILTLDTSDTMASMSELATNSITCKIKINKQVNCHLVCYLC